MKVCTTNMAGCFVLSMLSSNSAFSNVEVNNTCEILTHTGASLQAAINKYERNCTGVAREDCDRLDDGRWMCSSENIGLAAISGSGQSAMSETDSRESAVVDDDLLTADETVLAESEICTSTAASLGAAIDSYALDCPELPRLDCDPADGEKWVCSSAQIGDSSPSVVPGDDPLDPVNPTTPEPPDSPDEPVNEVPDVEEPDPEIPDPEQVPATDTVVHTYAKNAGPFKNPLKGWNTGWNGDNDHPESSVGFQYIPWRDFEPQNGFFNRNAVEARIDDAGSRNRHLILRLYCDWHGAEAESDCPTWMYSEVGVPRLKGNNGRYITDFNDPRYITQARQAIRALADEYDDDPRIYAVQMGVIGYWGEWHSWGSDINGRQYEIAESTMNQILNEYRASFDNAKIMARYPWREPTQSATGIGFHNDFFVTDNGHSEAFDQSVADGGQWMNSPIGGEVPPRGSGEANSERNALFNTDAGISIIELGHYSTMKAGSYRVTEGQQGYGGYMRLHKKMGYNYQIETARFSERVDRSGSLPVELIGTNIGVAPMYFDWDVQFALLDNNNQAVVIQDSIYDITSILPGDIFNFNATVSLSDVARGNYRLAIRIIQPNADKPKNNSWKLDARNTYILFSNDLPVVDGKWTNNVLTGGWSILGGINVQ